MRVFCLAEVPHPDFSIPAACHEVRDSVRGV
jgi:hypothetical protein